MRRRRRRIRDLEGFLTDLFVGIASLCFNQEMCVFYEMSVYTTSYIHMKTDDSLRDFACVS